jgi:hypothetical protein
MVLMVLVGVARDVGECTSLRSKAVTTRLFADGGGVAVTSSGVVEVWRWGVYI